MCLPATGVLLSLLLAGASAAPPQVADSLEAAPDTTAARPWGRAAVVGSAVALGVLEAHRRTQDGRRLTGPFDIGVRWAYADGADKLGHAWSAGIQAEAYAAAYRLTGQSPRRAAAWGAATSFAWMLHYEMLDGFGRHEVTDPTDIAANAVGAGMVVARAYVPELDAVRLKMSYWPSGGTCDITCDYGGQTAWLAVAPGSFVPEAVAWPAWLGVAVGYGVRDGSVRRGFEDHHVTLALDLEPGGLGLRGPVWEAVEPFARRVHLPSPGIRLTPRPRLVLAY